jgi:hypothetical protein
MEKEDKDDYKNIYLNSNIQINSYKQQLSRKSP